MAGPASETHRLSEFIDIMLRPFTDRVKSYVRDTGDFLSQLPTETTENVLLVSYDVVNLYSNIPHDLGIQAIDYWLKKYPMLLHSRIKPDFILEGIQFILKNNTFKCNDEFYKQVKGTAVGTKCAPVYATLVLAYLEETLYTEVENAFGSDFKTYFEENWKRFLDDCFLLFNRSEVEHQRLQNILNSLHPCIQFTCETSKTRLSFLDTMVIKNGKKLETDIYYKPTDSKQYLLYSSCHPKHTRNNIPYSLARRLRAIVSDENVLNLRMKELHQSLIKRGYPTAVIDDAISKATRMNRDVLLQTITKLEDQKVPYVSTFNPNNPEIFTEIRKNLPILFRSETMKRALGDKQIIKSKRQPQNLKRILTNAKFSLNDNCENSVTKCGRSNCGLCSQLIEGTEFDFKNGKIFKVNAPMTCNAKNVVYVILCRGCNELYIGETNNLRKRVIVHNQQIRDRSKRMIPLSGHIDKCSKLNPKYFIFPLFKEKRNSTVRRKEKEKFFINTFNPKLNVM